MNRQQYSLRICLAAIFALIQPLAAFSATPVSHDPKVISEGPYTPDGARQFVLHSQRVGRDFLVVVSTPSGACVTPGKKLPAIYTLDGGYGIAGPLGQMMAWSCTMSPAYVVSVSYPKGQVNQHDNDLLYSPVTRDGVTSGGGGAKFALFLTEELRPFLEARYPLDSEKAILFGHSYGGLFAANVLVSAPQSFSGYIIASPSVWADPQILNKLAQTVAAGNGKGRRVYVAVGGKESIDENRAPSMLEGATEIAETLSKPGSGFTVEKHVFLGETHISYWPQLVPAAFAWILPPPQASQARHTVITISPEALERFVGIYAIADGRVVTIRSQGSHLYAGMTGSPEGEILPETPQRFFAPIPGYEILITFEGDSGGRSEALVVSINGAETRAVRKIQ